jgi:hypothetical protein
MTTASTDNHADSSPIEFVGWRLDLAVAQAQGLPVKKDPMGFKAGSEAGYWIWSDEKPESVLYKLIGRDYSPSTLWKQGGRIIERYGIAIEPRGSEWVANKDDIEVFGSTALIAAMRCYLMLSGRNQ